MPQDANLIEKKHPYYGKSLIFNFPDFPHIMGFVAFFRCGKLMGKSMHFPYDDIASFFPVLYIK